MYSWFLESATALVMLYVLPCVTTYGCIERCNPFRRMVSPDSLDEPCLISMPDNPHHYGDQTIPCQLEIQPNCTGFCQVELTFAKFRLPKCLHNLTYESNYCDSVHSCEYVILQETGINQDGEEFDVIFHFDGNHTSDVYVSKTDRILLKFCYRSETFTARNIQLEFRAIDPEANKYLNIGPASVYILGGVVLFLALGIPVIRWCPWLKPCLDPNPQKRAVELNL